MKIIFSKEHIVKVFLSTYEIAKKIDIEVEPELNPSENTNFLEWMDGMDLIQKKKIQLERFHSLFSSDIPEIEFAKFWNSSDSTLGELAELISKYSAPRSIPILKFSGIECRSGSILRFILKELRLKYPKNKITGSTSVAHLAKKRNWYFFDCINVFFPGIIPPPLYISHKKLLPSHVLYIQKSLLFTFLVCLISIVITILLKSFIGLLTSSFLSIGIFLTILIYKRILKIPNTDHYIFPGITNLRDVSKRINSNLNWNYS